MSGSPHDELIRRADVLAKTDLGFFTERVFNTVSPNDVYEHNWHIDCIAEYLRAVERGEIKRLIVNLPPRMLKSISISIAWPAWLLGHNAKEQIIVCSYTAALGSQQSVKTRSVIQSEWYQRIFPGTVLQKELETELVTSAGGMRYTTGVGGSLLGMGGNYLIVDDPLDPEQSVSDIERKNANEWISSTFLTRFNDRRVGKAVVVMQRLHSDDVSGMLLERGGWTHLNLPGVFAEKKIISIGKKSWIVEKDEALDKKRLTPEVLEQIQRDYEDPFKYAAQILQNPTPDDGMFFKKDWWQFYDVLPENLKIYGSSDFATTEGDGDYTVHAIIGVDALDNWYVLEIYRERAESLTWATVQVDMMQQWEPVEWFEEAGTIFRAVDPLLRKIMEERGIYTYRHQVASIKDKETRAVTLRGKAAMKKIYFPRTAGFLQPLISELSKFPMGKHDDMVDALSLFARMMPVIRKGEFGSQKYELQNRKPGAITFNEALKEHKRILKRRREN